MPVDFNSLPNHKKREIVVAALEACKEMWGTMCMPAADIGDNNEYDMDDIINWVK